MVRPGRLARSGGAVAKPARTQPFQAQDIVSARHHRLVLSGELDMVAASQLETLIVELCSRGTSGITVDLSGITFIDSRGLRAILLARELAAEHGSEFSLIPGPPHVQRIFQLTNLLDVLPFQPYGDRESHQATERS